VFFKPLGIILPVWPTYALLQSGYVSLHMQLRRYFAIVVFIFLGWGGKGGVSEIIFFRIVGFKGCFQIDIFKHLGGESGFFPYIC